MPFDAVGSAWRRGQPERRTHNTALSISRIAHSRDRPVAAGGGKWGARISHSSSVRLLRQRKWLRSRRKRAASVPWIPPGVRFSLGFHRAPGFREPAGAASRQSFSPAGYALRRATFKGCRSQWNKPYRQSRSASTHLIIETLALENLLHTFLNPRLTSFGLFRHRKIENVCSLPSWRQSSKSDFQGGEFV